MYSRHYHFRAFIMLWLISSIYCGTFNISDDYFYGIEWLDRKTEASDTTLNSDVNDGSSFVVMHSTNKEVFHCHLPQQPKPHDYHESSPAQEGKKDIDLLKIMFLRTPCTYKVESYWSYELCHEKHLRQYHEEPQPDGTVKVTEYFLGHYKSSKDSNKEVATKGHSETTKPTEDINKLLLFGKSLPFYESNYTGGTHCDLINAPRSVSVRYVCQPSGKGELIEIVEVETCKYTAVVLTRHLCLHPAYKPVETFVNKIQCYNHASSEPSLKPKSLMELEATTTARINSGMGSLEGLFGRETTVEDLNTGSLQVETIKTNDATIIFKFKPSEEESSESDVKNLNEAKQEAPNAETSSAQRAALIKSFLSGEYCVVGGTGWWKHEFCFQKSVLQFHDEPGEDRKVVMVGLWNKEKHLQYMRDNPHHRPSLPPQKRMELHHFYTGGDVCAETKKPRRVLVILRCLAKEGAGVSIQFTEPHTCDYLMQVSSALFCTMIQQADEDGLIPEDIV